MRDKNTQFKSEFVFTNLWWTFVTWFLYKAILFRCLGTHSLKESRMILLALILAAFAVGMLLEMKKWRNSVSIIMNLLGEYGIYAVITYFPIRTKFILMILIVSAVLAIAYSLLILCRRIDNRRRFKRILWNRIIMVFRGSANVFCVGMGVIMIAIGINLVFSSSIVIPDVEPAGPLETEESTIDNNIETLALLYEDTWKTLSAEEKLDVLQTVANIERRYLGLPHELNVVTADLSEDLVGYYLDTSHEIMVDVNCLLYNSSYDLTKTVTHEAYHSLEHRMVDAYNEASDDLKKLMLFYSASVYKEEFEDYTRGEDDFYEYYDQQCEADARRYASSAAWEYFDRIYEYLGVER